MRIEPLVWEDCGKIIKAYTPWNLHIYSLFEVEDKKYKVYIVNDGAKSDDGLTLLLEDPVSLRRGKQICQRCFNRGRKQFLKAVRAAD